jgi:plastocyanin
MKKIARVLALSVALVAVIAAVGCSASSTPPATPGGSSSAPAATTGSTTVTIKNFTFEPASVTIKVGESVEFKNEDSVAHTVTGTSFDSGEIAPGASFFQKFDTAGTEAYKCSIHPQMTGTVIVQ